MTYPHDKPYTEGLDAITSMIEQGFDTGDVLDKMKELFVPREGQRYITVWRKPDDVLNWDFHFSEDGNEVETVVANLIKRGVKQYSTHPISGRLAALTSEF